MRLRRFIVAAALVFSAPWAPARAEPGVAAAVVVPLFVDPHRHFDVPDLTPGTTLRFLTGDDDPPFAFPAPDGSLAGYNVDLARAVCEVLKVVCSIQSRPFETLVPALDAKGGDAVIGSLAMTPRAWEQVDFSLPTLRTVARFAARTGGPTGPITPETVTRAVIGVQAGTAHEAFLRARFTHAVLRPYPDPGSLREALRTGAVDLLFADGVATALWLNGTTGSACCAFVGGPFLDSRFFGDGTGIAVRKGDAGLRQALDYALTRLAADGTTGDLYLKYFPVGFY